MTSLRPAVRGATAASPGAGTRGLSRRCDTRAVRARAAAAGLAAVAGLAALVAAPPVLLYEFAGSPLPRQLPGWHQLVAALFGRDDAAVVLAVVRDGTWLAWLAFTACVLAETVAAIRGRRAPRLRLGGIQGAAARLITLVALAAGAWGASALSASAATVTGQQASHAQAGPVRAESLPVPGVPGSVPVSDAWILTVQSGDCLWSIAQRYLGAGDEYPEIARLNYGRAMGDGEVFN
jgi:nucleoid-associated protein YgaU